MDKLFNKLGLAITFSPTGKALLKETRRLINLFGSELALIHVGEKNPQIEKLLFQTIAETGLSPEKLEIIWSKGDPANSIIRAAGQANVDLLVAGALEKETLIKYYIGSVARKIMRSASSSVLILKSPSENPISFKKFFVSTDFSSESENTIKTAYQFAMKENAHQFVIVRDFNIPGLASTVLDSGSLDETENTRARFQQEEEEKMRFFVNELNLKGMEINTKCLYGKEGWEASNYARENKADIFAVTGPVKKIKFIDRLFPHEVEYSFENLPSNLLIVR